MNKDNENQLNQLQSEKIRNVAKIIASLSEKTGLSICFFVAEETSKKLNGCLSFCNFSDMTMKAFVESCLRAPPFIERMGGYEDGEVTDVSLKRLHIKPLNSFVKKIKDLLG